MTIAKQIKDGIIKFFWEGNMVPLELFELSQYFRNNGAINFDFKKDSDGIVAISNNFRQGKIIASAKTENDLDENIKDAILTAFEVPSSYRKEAGVHKVGKEDHSYAFA